MLTGDIKLEMHIHTEKNIQMRNLGKPQECDRIIRARKATFAYSYRAINSQNVLLGEETVEDLLSFP